MTKTDKTAQPETCAGQKPHLILVANEKGGVRKTSTVLAAAELLGGAGVPAEIIQIDDQARLQRLYPNATRINLPKASEIRSVDMAETKALDPLFEAFRPRTDTALIDIGANYDTRVAEFLAGMDVEREIKRHRLVVKVIVPITSDPEAIRLGARTAKRMAIAMPSATIHPLFALDGGDFDFPIDEVAARAMKDVLTPLANTNGAIHMPKLFPTLLGFLEGKSILMGELMNVDIDDFAAAHSLSRAYARSFRSELILYLDKLGDEFRRVLRFP